MCVCVCAMHVCVCTTSICISGDGRGLKIVAVTEVNSGTAMVGMLWLHCPCVCNLGLLRMH